MMLVTLCLPNMLKKKVSLFQPKIYILITVLLLLRPYCQYKNVYLYILFFTVFTITTNL